MYKLLPLAFIFLSSLFTQTEHISYNQQNTCKLGVTSCEFKTYQESKLKVIFLMGKKLRRKWRESCMIGFWKMKKSGFRRR